MADEKTCPDCGAALPEGAERCTLCGTPVSENATEADAEEREPATPSDPTTSEDASGSASAGGASLGTEETAGEVFCNECGWKNPAGANFCSRCGHRLQSVERDSTPPGTRPAEGPFSDAAGDADSSETPTPAGLEAAAVSGSGGDGLNRRAALVIGVAVLLVAVLFTWSAMSGGAQSEAAEATPGAAPTATRGAGGPGAPTSASLADGEVPEAIRAVQREAQGALSGAQEAQADSLRGVIDARDGRHQRLARRQLARLYAEAGLRGPAAAEQWLLARETEDDPEVWERAGVLLYDWMTTLRQGQDRAKTAEVARLTSSAYERFLQAQPQNHDARTDLAVAYLFTNNPMRGISEIRRVLDEAPDHVGARFNFGLMQRMIGRNATALAQFERVRELVGEDSPYYEQAGLLIDEINQETGGDPQDTPMPGSGGGPAAGAPGS